MQPPSPYSSGYPSPVPPPSQYPSQGQPPYPNPQGVARPPPYGGGPYGAPPLGLGQYQQPGYPYAAAPPQATPSGYQQGTPYQPGPSQSFQSPSFNGHPQSYYYGAAPPQQNTYPGSGYSDAHYPPHYPSYQSGPPGAQPPYPPTQGGYPGTPPAQAGYPQYPQQGGPPPGGPSFPSQSAPLPASGPPLPPDLLNPSPSLAAYAVPPPASGPPSGSMPAYPPPITSGPPGATGYAPMPVNPAPPGVLPHPTMFPGPAGHHLTSQNFPAVIGVASEDGCGPLRAPDEMGPMLRYNTMDLGTGHWLGSVLFVMRSPHPSPTPPNLTITILQNRAPVMAPYVLPAQHLHTLHGWHFWRFELALPMGQGEGERCVQYGLEGRKELWSFWIPGQNQSWHWSYYSCAGYSSSLDACKKVSFDTLVMELMRRHGERPQHVCFGGGDQLYNDQVFRLHTVKEWKARPRDIRERDPFTPAMEAEVETYYFAHYMSHYSHRWMAQLVSSIPQMMMWDDHDIFDGYGSYPPSLQNCEVFQRLYKVARFFYLLFQQHTTDGLAERHGLIKTSTALTQIALLGPRVVLLAVDMRSERTKDQILPPGGWTRVADELRRMPTTVKHVVVGSGVPVVYPSLGEVERMMESISEYNRADNKGGFGGAIQNVLGGAMNMVFDEPELLDDLNDHWNAKGHMREKEEMVKMFQNLAATRRMRISFISGDVHLCATGRLRTAGKDKKETDPNYMLQVVSSAIVNEPPPDGLVTFLSSKGLFSNVLFGSTEERMRATFGGGIMNVTNVKSKLLNRRNFCIIQEVAGGLMFTLVVEMPGNKYKLYPTSVPPITLDITSQMQGMNLRAATMAPSRSSELDGSQTAPPVRSKSFFK